MRKERVAPLQRPCLFMPFPSEPLRPLPIPAVPHRAYLSWPCHTSYISPVPNKLSPVGRDNTIPKSLGNHAAVPVVGSKYMAPSTQGSEILQLISSVLAALDVVDVALFKGLRSFAPDACLAVTFPNDASKFVPDLTWRAMLRHSFCRRGCQTIQQ